MLNNSIAALVLEKIGGPQSGVFMLCSKYSSWFGRAVIASTIILAACKPSNSSDPTFAVSATRDAKLLELFKSQNSPIVDVSICYVARDSTNEQVNQRTYQQLKGYIEDAFRKWMSPLKGGVTGSTGNPIQAPKPYALKQDLKSKCLGSENIKVYFYRSNTGFRNTCKRFWSPHEIMQGGCRSYAMPALGEIWLDLSAEMNQRALSQTVLHELGHLFGMLDTYREEGALSNESREFQPLATVMSSDRVNELANDDREGIRALWKAVSLRERYPSCPSGYKLHAMDGWYGSYCILEKTNTSESEKKPSPDSSGMARHYDCTEHLAMMGSWGGCLKFLVEVRAEKRGTTVNNDLDENDLLAAVDACVAAYPGQTTTCTKKLLSCLTWQWADDNYACFAGRGGNACFARCKNP